MNQITAEEAAEAPEVVLGMLLVNFNSATVLFDSGASHSFVSRQFAAQHLLDMHHLHPPHVIHSPGSVFMTDQICRNVNINIEGVDFWADLIVINSKGLDVILGMDWLSKNLGQINCARRSISITNEDGISVVFQSRTVNSHLCVLQVDATPTLESVPVVCEYPDVFPEDLPGLDRKSVV